MVRLALPVLLLPLLALPSHSLVFLGRLSTNQHNVKGRLAALTPSSLLLARFSYDGLGPDAFFVVGTSGSPGEGGTILPYPHQGKFFEYTDPDAPLIPGKFDNDELILQLPDSIRADQVVWFSIWCRKFGVNFGSLTVPEGIDFSSLNEVITMPVMMSQGEVKVGALSEMKHGVRGQVAFSSPSNLVISDFSYDGLGPDAFFLVGTSGDPGNSGTILSYPADDKAYQYDDQEAPILRRSFDKEVVMLTLPNDLTAKDIAWVSVWCREFSVDFGSLAVPRDLDLNPLFAPPPMMKPMSSPVLRVGALSENAHGVRGSVSFTGPSSLLLSDFSYDGLGPAGYFTIGTFGRPGDTGTILSYPAGTKSYDYDDVNAPIIRRSFSREDVMLTLPASISVEDVVWVSVWCQEFDVDFGSVFVPKDLDFSILSKESISLFSGVISQTERPALVPITTTTPTTTRTTTRAPKPEPTVSNERPAFAPPATTEGPRRPPKTTTTASGLLGAIAGVIKGAAAIIFPGEGNSLFTEVNGDPNICFSYSAGRPTALVPDMMNAFSARLELPGSGLRALVIRLPRQALVIRLPRQALMVEAFTSSGDYLGKLTSNDGLTWQLEGLEESYLVLQVTVKPGSGSRRLRGVTLNGWDVQQCGADRRQTKPKRKRGPACLKVDRAVFGNNIAIEDDVLSAEACWEQCQELAACKFWNLWTDGESGRCYLKSGRGQRGDREGYVFGARACRPQA